MSECRTLTRRNGDHQRLVRLVRPHRLRDRAAHFRHYARPDWVRISGIMHGSNVRISADVGGGWSSLIVGVWAHCRPSPDEVVGRHHPLSLDFDATTLLESMRALERVADGGCHLDVSWHTM